MHLKTAADALQMDITRFDTTQYHKHGNSEKITSL